ncbi:MAG: hypothetical protein JNM56_13055 [Planctomycetia bacterium]|nr:hypothetical protein [Planctomycetia bacterium]
MWDGVERFFYYDHWLKYIIDHFLVPWGYVLNGAVKWQGYYRGDRGTLRVRQNQVERNTQWPND